LFCENNDLTSLENIPDTIHPNRFCCAENPLHYDFDLIACDTLENIREYNKKMYYKKVKPPMYKEKLMQSLFHPTRVWKYLDKFDYNILVDEYNIV